MKTTGLSFSVSLLLLTASTAALAQEEFTDEDISYESSNADTVVYNEPTTYLAPVVYQSAVIYNAPVFYVAAAAATIASCSAQPPCEPSPTPSTVTVVGLDGVYTYSNQEKLECDNGSTVVQFGERGGWFGGRW